MWRECPSGGLVALTRDAVPGCVEEGAWMMIQDDLGKLLRRRCRRHTPRRLGVPHGHQSSTTLGCHSSSSKWQHTYIGSWVDHEAPLMQTISKQLAQVKLMRTRPTSCVLSLSLSLYIRSFQSLTQVATLQEHAEEQAVKN